MTAMAFKVPTDCPESDGTLEWNSTTLVLVQLTVGKTVGTGYTYTHECCVPLIRDVLFPILSGRPLDDVAKLVIEMTARVRNLGRHGLASCAMAAVEIALWDLLARRLQISLSHLWGKVRDEIPVYGSGGFTSYSRKQLQRQFEQWSTEGIRSFKMKTGREPEKDETRLKWARDAIGDVAELFADSNGAHSPKTALALAEKLAEYHVTWFEEPVSSDDWEGLNFIRGNLPKSIEVAAGEYIYDVIQARRMLDAGAVDVLQADVTRCGVSNFLAIGSMCEAFQMPFSAHTAPALHAHLACSVNRVRHVEYFHDHVRIERLFFEGATTQQRGGSLAPDFSAPGHGLDFKAKEAARFRISV
jgi:L-alanine-DL-glutamate epimerase-like enolase superfamily enzyme